jgi:hypothetical protein
MHAPASKILPRFRRYYGPASYPGETEDVSGIVWDRRGRMIVNYCRQDIIEIDTCMLESSERYEVGQSTVIPRYWTGRTNHQTFLKEVAILGCGRTERSDFILSGGDCGNLFIWSRCGGEKPICKLPADPYVLNCVSVHPLGLPIIATSGIATVADIWEPIGPFANRDWTAIEPHASKRLYVESIQRRVAELELSPADSADQELWLRKIEEAIKIVQDNRDIFGANILARLYGQQGYVLSNLGRFRECINTCTLGLEIEPGNVSILAVRALGFISVGEYHQAYLDMANAGMAEDTNPRELIGQLFDPLNTEEESGDSLTSSMSSADSSTSESNGSTSWTGHDWR